MKRLIIALAMLASFSASAESYTYVCKTSENSPYTVITNTQENSILINDALYAKSGVDETGASVFTAGNTGKVTVKWLNDKQTVITQIQFNKQTVFLCTNPN